LILNYLNVVNILKLEQVCRKFKQVINQFTDDFYCIDLNGLNSNAKVVEMQRYFIRCPRVPVIKVNRNATAMVLAKFLENSKNDIKFLEIPYANIELSRFLSNLKMENLRVFKFMDSKA
jgi:hypothetical protein